MSTIPPSSAALQLEYGTAPPPWRKRIVRILLALAFIAILAFAWRFGPFCWHQTKLLYWQRQCMNFTLSPDTVVYEEDPIAAAVLLHVPNYSPYVLYRGEGSNNHPTIVQAAALFPSCWHTLGTFVGQPIATHFSFGPGGGGAGAIIFLHERISPSGHRRLVCVHYAPDTPTFVQSFIEGYNYDTSAGLPATWTKPLTFARRLYVLGVLSGFPRHPPLVRTYAGQPDPNDPAHFTIRYQMWGQEDVLDGQLLDNDQVTLTPRHLPDDPIK